MGTAPEPVAFPHFPDPLHAYVGFNWELVPPSRLASVVGASEERILDMGYSMGLPEPKPVSEDQWRRSYITLIRRTWHLLPYEQLLALLDWTDEELAYCLREDDFLFTKLGGLKPNTPPLRYAPPDEAAQKRAAEITALVRAAFPEGLSQGRNRFFISCRNCPRRFPKRQRLRTGKKASSRPATVLPTSCCTAIPSWSPRPMPIPTATWRGWRKAALPASGCRRCSTR
jgi:hypothetical protein